MSRSMQVAKNVLSGFVGQFATMLLSFATRTVFIYTLSAAYLGVSGLFTSILTVLNLSELGIAASITYALYKPLANDDKEKIKSLMHFYKKAYKLIGCVILIVGVAILPILDKLISGETDLANVRIVFLLYIAESVVSYWFFAYKRTLLEANQQKYVVTVFSTLSTAVISMARIGVLLLLRSDGEIAFYAYIVVGIIGTIICNLLISQKVDKVFPYLKEETKKLTKDEIKPIYKNITGLIVSKISGIMITSVDNILISMFLNVSLVGIYSNYIALKTYVQKPIGIVFESMTAGVGDYCAKETLDNQEAFFKTIQFMHFWIYGFCAISLWTLLNPFIGGIWINEEYLMSDFAVFLIVINFLLDGLAGAVIKFRDANGLYWQAKYRYLFSAVFNGVISFLLIKPLGVEGVLLGTTASILIMISFDPIIVYRNVFHKSSWRYYIDYLKYLLIVIGTGVLVTIMTQPLPKFGLGFFVIRMLICLLVPNCLWYLIFRKSYKFKYLKDRVKMVIGQIKRMVRR